MDFFQKSVNEGKDVLSNKKSLNKTQDTGEKSKSFDLMFNNIILDQSLIFSSDFFDSKISDYNIFSSQQKDNKKSILNISNFDFETKSHFAKQKKFSEKKKKKLKKTKSNFLDLEKGCKCNKSNCLRLHCSCFSILGFCSQFCKCKNCLNKSEYNKPRDFVIKKTKMIYKNAFKKKSKKIHINGFVINSEGCNCNKGCINNYCGCKKINGKCSPICKCLNCVNDKIFISREEIQKIYKPCFRRKHKIIINFDKNMIKLKKII